MFTRNPRGWKSKPLDKGEVTEFRDSLQASSLFPVVAHMPYLPNLASSGEFYQKSVESLTTELQRCVTLGIDYLVTHLGSHQGTGYSTGLNQICNALAKALNEVSDGTMILLENTAGTTHSMGSSFEELARILHSIHDRIEVGICFDTCHAYAAGYDIGTATAVEAAMKRFDESIGLDRLKVIHLNDSKGGLRSRLDRHERIGRGFIGETGFRALLSHPKVRATPLILETPVENDGDELIDMARVRELAQSP